MPWKCAPKGRWSSDRQRMVPIMNRNGANEAVSLECDFGQ